MSETLLEQLNQITRITESLRLPQFRRAGYRTGFVGRAHDPKVISDVLRLKQVHGRTVLDAHSIKAGQKIEGDGLYTRTPGVWIGVNTADCVPILIAARGPTPMAMAIHAGWRGLVAGIILEGVTTFKRLGYEPKHLVAAVGPCISATKYEVGTEVIEQLSMASSGLGSDEIALAYSPVIADKSLLDVGLVAAMQLLKSGIPARQLSILVQDTYSQPEMWYSYRRAKAYEGNNVSFITPIQT